MNAQELRAKALLAAVNELCRAVYKLYFDLEELLEGVTPTTPPDTGTTLPGPPTASTGAEVHHEHWWRFGS